MAKFPASVPEYSSAILINQIYLEPFKDLYNESRNTVCSLLKFCCATNISSAASIVLAQQ
jgi:hypothetical protein